MIPTPRDQELYASWSRSITAAGWPYDRILLTASTSEAYGYLFKLLCDPGDEVLVPRPSYPLFEYLARLENVRVAAVPAFLRPRLASGRTRDRATGDGTDPRCGVVNPNNPTGHFLKGAEWTALCGLCERRGLRSSRTRYSRIIDFAPDAHRVSLRGRCVTGARVFTERLIEDRRVAADEAGVDRARRARTGARRSMGPAGSHRRHVSVGRHSCPGCSPIAVRVAIRGAGADTGSALKRILRSCEKLSRPGASRAYSKPRAAGMPSCRFRGPARKKSGRCSSSIKPVCSCNRASSTTSSARPFSC